MICAATGVTSKPKLFLSRRPALSSRLAPAYLKPESCSQHTGRRLPPKGRPLDLNSASQDDLKVLPVGTLTPKRSSMVGLSARTQLVSKNIVPRPPMTRSKTLRSATGQEVKSGRTVRSGPRSCTANYWQSLPGRFGTEHVRPMGSSTGWGTNFPEMRCPRCTPHGERSR
jgi:hypothetical protein